MVRSSMRDMNNYCSSNNVNLSNRISSNCNSNNNNNSNVGQFKAYLNQNTSYNLNNNASNSNQLKINRLILNKSLRKN